MTPRRIITTIFLLLIAYVSMSGSLSAGVYKWQDADGVWHYTNQQPPDDVEDFKAEEEIRNSGYSYTPPAKSYVSEPEAKPERKGDNAEAQIREFAARKYPGDAKMRQYIYRQQISAYNYMLDVDDKECKAFAKRKYPDDFAMQKYIYDQQTSAKRYMQSLPSSDVKEFANRKYPDDYSMQKYVYDKQLSAKEYMQRQSRSASKDKAVRKYPDDYAMQKYIYDQ